MEPLSRAELLNLLCCVLTFTIRKSRGVYLLRQWDVSRVTDADYMFYAASAFDSDLSDWNTSSTTTMSNMFNGASTFNSNLASWDVSAVTDMKFMFKASSVFNSDLCSWGAMLLKPGVVMGGMFSGSGCQEIRDPDLRASPPGPFCHVC